MGRSSVSCIFVPFSFLYSAFLQPPVDSRRIGRGFSDCLMPNFLFRNPLLVPMKKDCIRTYPCYTDGNVRRLAAQTIAAQGGFLCSGGNIHPHKYDDQGRIGSSDIHFLWMKYLPCIRQPAMPIGMWRNQHGYCKGTKTHSKLCTGRNSARSSCRGRYCLGSLLLRQGLPFRCNRLRGWNHSDRRSRRADRSASPSRLCARFRYLRPRRRQHPNRSDLHRVIPGRGGERGSHWAGKGASSESHLRAVCQGCR